MASLIIGIEQFSQLKLTSVNPTTFTRRVMAAECSVMKPEDLACLPLLDLSDGGVGLTASSMGRQDEGGEHEGMPLALILRKL